MRSLASSRPMQIASPWRRCRRLPCKDLVGTRLTSMYDKFAKEGPSDEEIRVGVEWYTCLVVALPQPNRRPPSLEEICPRTVEGVIAHEVTHLRWRTLRHGPEFYARSLGLLRGATFPSRGGWSKSTHDTMNATREKVRGWFTRLEHSQEGIQAD